MADPRRDRDNNFNLLRLIAASSVIFSHGHEIGGYGYDPIRNSCGYSGGWIAVSAFFSMSGFMIYLSMMRGKSIREFIIARFLRIFPGLWMMLLVSVLLLGTFVSTEGVGAFFSSPETWKYFAGNAALFLPQYILPGVFDNLPQAGVVNGSLWTLRFEFLCYMAVLALFLVGAFRTEASFRAFVALGLLAFAALLLLSQATSLVPPLLNDESGVAKVYRLGFAFFLGMIFGHYSLRVEIKGWHVLICGSICYAAYGTPLFLLTLISLIAVSCFWFAFLKHRWLVPFRAMDDFSYGIYVYAFPIQQLVAQCFPNLGVIEHSIASLVLTLPFAAISWYTVERPALRQKTRILGLFPKPVR